jgi:hypothetical protein
MGSAAPDFVRRELSPIPFSLGPLQAPTRRRRLREPSHCVLD